MSWLRLIRWKNLLIIFITQLFAWRFVIVPIHPFVLNLINFLWLSTSTLLIAGAGYIINDYFDVKIDNINKPQKVVLGTNINRKLAMLVHTVLNIIAISMAGWLAYREGHPLWVLLQLGCSICLWFYSTHFKKQYIIGNVVVSLLTSLTIFVLLLYEPHSHSYHLHTFYILILYCYFAFILNWMREIVKDMEDIKGDEAEGCNTMPIKKGLQFSIVFVIILSQFAIIPLFAVFLYNPISIIGMYILLLLIIPIIIWCNFFRKKFTTEHFQKASRWLKFIMISGVLTFPISYLQQYLHSHFNW